VASKSSKWGVERVGRVGEYFPVDGCLAEVLLSTLFKQDGTGIAGGIRAQQSDAGGQAILFSTYAKCLVTFYPGIQEHARRSQMVALQPRSRVERNSFAPTYRICFDLGTPWDALGRLGTPWDVNFVDADHMNHMSLWQYLEAQQAVTMAVTMLPKATFGQFAGILPTG